MRSTPLLRLLYVVVYWPKTVLAVTIAAWTAFTLGHVWPGQVIAGGVLLVVVAFQFGLALGQAAGGELPSGVTF